MAELLTSSGWLAKQAAEETLQAAGKAAAAEKAAAKAAEKAAPVSLSLPASSAVWPLSVASEGDMACAPAALLVLQSLSASRTERSESAVIFVASQYLVTAPSVATTRVSRSSEEALGSVMAWSASAGRGRATGRPPAHVHTCAVTRE